MDPEIATWNYRTPDGSQRITLTTPFGLIAPPTLDLHVPLWGPLTFYSESMYQFPENP